MDWDEVTQQKHWLSADEIDQIISNASADDIVEALATYPDVEKAPLSVSKEIFNRSAQRLGILPNGATAAQMVHAQDFQLWTEKLGRLLGRDSPLPELTDLSPDSADSGE